MQLQIMQFIDPLLCVTSAGRD